MAMPSSQLEHEQTSDRSPRQTAKLATMDVVARSLLVLTVATK